MDPASLRRLLDQVADGELSPEEASVALAHLPFADLGNVRLDHHRAVRTGLPEAVYAPAKSTADLRTAVAGLLGVDGGPGAAGGPVVVSRLTPEQVDELVGEFGGVGGGPTTTWGPVQGDRPSATLVWRPAPLRPGTVVVAAAGTADVAVAEECAAVLVAHGVAPTRLTDVGVAGIHRLLGEVEGLQAADVVVAVAGMEGALASVVGGLTAAPVVAVPTSAGYGSSMEGVTALLAMLSSCAPGVTVVGIDNGFGAACAALRLLNTIERSGSSGGRGTPERSEPTPLVSGGSSSAPVPGGGGVDG